MSKPLLSVVVPTKDRYKYLKHLIKLIQSFDRSDIEIIVQDNTEDNHEILDFLSILNYTGCKYFHECGQLPMSTNADKAILHSNGEFVCFLGDDDGVCPNILGYCQYLKENGIEAMRSNLAMFRWPHSSNSIKKKYGRFTYRCVSHSSFKLKSQDVLMDVITRGFVDRGNLPSVYHGVVARTALDRIYQKCGTFFPGQSPDISNGIATALVLDDFLYVDDIVTISGASEFHGGVTLGMKKKYPQIQDMLWFRPNAEINWEKKLPKIAVGNIIWAESSIETLNNMSRPDLVANIDFETIYKFFVVYYYPLRNMAYALSSHPAKLACYANIGYTKRVLNAIQRRFFQKLGLNSGNYILKRVKNIQECVNLFQK